jgi:hypothetical protein
MKFNELAQAIQGDVEVEGIARWDVHRERHSLDLSPLAAAHDPSYRPGRFVLGLPEWRGTFECEASMVRPDYDPRIGPFNTGEAAVLRFQNGDEIDIWFGEISFELGRGVLPITYEFTGHPSSDQKVAAMQEP